MTQNGKKIAVSTNFVLNNFTIKNTRNINELAYCFQEIQISKYPSAIISLKY